MGGFCTCSTRIEAHEGSQWHRGFDWLQDPLTGDIQTFMNTTIQAGFGPINVPFLSAVTQLTGTGYNSLAAVATIPLPTVFPVDILVSNVPQRWFLVAGTTSGGSGITIPNDYNPTTNAKYWVQLE